MHCSSSISSFKPFLFNTSKVNQPLCTHKKVKNFVCQIFDLFGQVHTLCTGLRPTPTQNIKSEKQTKQSGGTTTTLHKHVTNETKRGNNNNIKQTRASLSPFSTQKHETQKKRCALVSFLCSLPLIGGATSMVAST